MLAVRGSLDIEEALSIASLVGSTRAMMAALLAGFASNKIFWATDLLNSKKDEQAIKLYWKSECIFIF